MRRLVAMVVLVGAAGLVAVAALRDGDAGEPPTVAAVAPDATTTTRPALTEAPEKLGQAQELHGLDGWLQTDAESLADFDEPVKIVQFWTFGCINCKRTLPNLIDLYDTYEGQGLEIIGVHTPEFDHEAEVDNIVQAAENLGVRWPIALDTNKANFRRWQTERRFWPRTFVVDANNEIRFDRIGEGAYEELRDTVAYLLENGGA